MGSSAPLERHKGGMGVCQPSDAALAEPKFTAKQVEHAGQLLKQGKIPHYLADLLNVGHVTLCWAEGVDSSSVDDERYSAITAQPMPV